MGQSAYEGGVNIVRRREVSSDGCDCVVVVVVGGGGTRYRSVVALRLGHFEGEG